MILKDDPLDFSSSTSKLRVLLLIECFVGTIEIPTN